MPTAPLRIWRALAAAAFHPLASRGVALAVLLGLGACATGADSFGDDPMDGAAPTDAATPDAASNASSVADAATADAALDASAVTDGATPDAADASGAADASDASPFDCVIGGHSYASAAENPADPCQVCAPSASTTSWTQQPDNFYWCGNSCVNSLTDPNNCGGCENVCVSGSCVNGGCADQCTIGGQSYVSGAANPADPCQLCAPGTTTTSWTQQPGNFYWCGNSCVNSLTDPSNCGGCENVCASGQQCSNGGCVAP